MTADSEQTLLSALLESRGRWRDLALLSADLLFETDGEGRLTFLAPAEPLGHDAARLLGMRGGQLRAEEAAADPFDPAAPPRGLRCWLRRADGETACLEFNAVAVAGGLRGSARDVTEEERRAEATARALRRATALVRLLGDAQRSRAGGGAAASALLRLLEGILPGLGCTGAALLEATQDGWRVALLAGIAGLLPPPAEPGGMEGARGGCALVPVAPGLALAAWREPPPDAEDIAVLAALGPPLAALHAEAGRQQELAAAARTDPLTGLLNRRGFAAMLQASRDQAPRGVLAFLDMDGLKRLNDRHGHAAGDAAIGVLAQRLRAACRPGDVAARLGGDEFALWLPGIGLEAARLRCLPLGVPAALGGHPAAGDAAVAASVGLAEAGPGDTTEALIARADAEMYAHKRARRAAA
jgi:diguanylate cyclase (GGDEF)-like protein